MNTATFVPCQLVELDHAVLFNAITTTLRVGLFYFSRHAPNTWAWSISVHTSAGVLLLTPRAGLVLLGNPGAPTFQQIIHAPVESIHCHAGRIFGGFTLDRQRLIARCQRFAAPLKPFPVY